jgi:hypothetical protein
MLLALGGVIVSFALGIGLAAARGILLDDRVYDMEDVDRIGLASVLVVVPPARQQRWWRRG